MAWMNLNAFITVAIEISQALGFVLKQMNQRDEERNDLY